MLNTDTRNMTERDREILADALYMPKLALQAARMLDAWADKQSMRQPKTEWPAMVPFVKAAITRREVREHDAKDAAETEQAHAAFLERCAGVRALLVENGPMTTAEVLNHLGGARTRANEMKVGHMMREIGAAKRRVMRQGHRFTSWELPNP